MEKPLIKDKSIQAYVSYLQEELDKFQKSPYVNSYLSIKKLIDKGNTTINDMATSKDFDFESDKFKGIEKFLSKQKDYYEQMEYFRSKMAPNEKKLIDGHSLGIAEQIALSTK